MAWTAGKIYACNPATERNVSTKLGVDPKGEKLIYTNGRAVIIRDINHPEVAHAYTQHTTAATVARFSPSGYYVASGDKSGNVRVWDATNPAENILKLEKKNALGGRINDLAWDGESKRIIVGGEGREKFGAAFLMDSGSSCGEITGHGKPISSVAVRQQRPFRAVSGSEDSTVVFHTAVPFKYDKLLTNHTNFVRDVGFAPNGDLFASVGSDGKLYLYDGKTGELKTEASVESKRSLMALSWSPDSTRIATAGADGIVAIWDAATAKIAQSYTIGSDVVDQQNGVVYANKDSVVSVSLSGDLNVFDLRESGDKWRKLYGPTKAITAALGVGKGDNQTFYTGAFNGTMNAFAIGSSYGDREGECTPVAGTGHTGRIVGLASNSKDKVFTTAWDDKVSSIVGGSFSSTSVPMKAQPTAIAATPTATYVSSPEGIEILPADGSPATLHPGAATAVAAHASADGDLVAFGAGPTKLVLGKAKGGQIAVLAEFDRNAGDVLALAFSPDGSLLASGDSKGRIVLVDVKSHEVLVGMKWIVHTGRIAQLEFSPSGRRIVSGANDEGIVVTDIDNIMGYVTIRNTHPGGVSGVHWESDTKIISSGADACVRTWEVPIKKKA